MKSYWDSSKYALAGVFLIVCLGIFGMFNLIMQPKSSSNIIADPQDHITAYITTGNIFSGLFTEPFETMVLLARDGTFFAFTTQHDWIIAVSPSYVHERLLKENIEPKDIVIIIHNHLSPGNFSTGDTAFYRYFQRRGFKGSFCVYYPFSKHVIVKED